MNELARGIAKNILKDDTVIESRIERGIEENRKGVGEITLVNHEGKAISKANIKLRHIRHEFHFGCNSFMLGQFDEKEKNAAHDKAFKNLFNLAVVPFYWNALEPEDGKLRFDKNSPKIHRRPPPDEVLEFCEKNNIVPKGHPLTWHMLFPKWLPMDKKALAKRIEQHIEEIAERYGKRIGIWDVCNEAVKWDPTLVNIRMPDGHVEFAFKVASRCLPNSAILAYNDYSCWDNHGDYTPMYMILRHLKSLNVNVGATGLQFHLFGRPMEQMRNEADIRLNPYNLFACLDQYAKLDLPINISEITIPAHPDLGDGPAFQKEVSERLYKIWFSHAATNGIVWWNLIDNTAFVNSDNPSWDENQYKGGLLNYDLSPKPVYKALERLIKEEWQTNTSIAYVDDDKNSFRGFYGDYEVKVETNAGTFHKELKLSRGSINKFKLDLK